MFGEKLLFFEYPALFLFCAAFFAVAVLSRFAVKRRPVIISAVYIVLVVCAFFVLMYLGASLGDVATLLMLAVLPQLVFMKKDGGEDKK